MSRLFVCLAFFLFTDSAKAQPGLLVALPDTTVSAVAPDTVAAIHRLFASRRLRRDLIAVGLGIGPIVGAIISSSGDNTNSGKHGGGGYGSLGSPISKFDGADYLLLYAVPAVPLILLDYAVYARYSRKREKKVLEDFQAHRLSTQFRRKLQPRYFQ